MGFSFYKLLWALLHVLVDLLEAIFFFGVEFRENFFNYVKNLNKRRRKHEKESDAKLIEQHITELKKLPKHLAVIVKAENEKDVDLRKLTNLVLWSMSSGVNFISFYDHKGEAWCENNFRGSYITPDNQTLPTIKLFGDDL
jgi:hypothetical protein